MSDHHLLIGAIQGVTRGPPGTPPPAAPRKIRWHLLDPPDAHLLSSLPDDRRQALLDRHQQRLNNIAATITRDALSAPDLVTLNTTLLAIAARHLGHHPPPREHQNHWMWCPRAAAAHGQWRKAYKAWSRRKNATRKHKLNAAQHAFHRAKTRAIIRHRQALVRKIAAGNIPVFFGIYRHHRAPRADTAGVLLDPAATAAAWSEIFSRQPEAPETPLADRRPLASTRSIQLEPQTVAQAIRLSQSTSPGPDGLPTRFIKRFAALLLPSLHRLYSLALRHGLPAQLKKGRTVLIPKTSPPSVNPLDYRPITVLPALTRLFHLIVVIRITEIATQSSLFSPFQAGFRPGRCTYDQIFILSTLASACRAAPNPTPFIMAFLDVEKAFDSISHEILVDVLLKTLKLPAPWVEVIRLILLDNHTTILGRDVPFTRGCLQGSPLSPLLCILLFEDLYRYLRTQFPYGPPLYPPGDQPDLPLNFDKFGLLLSLLGFADDVASGGTSLPDQATVVKSIGDWGSLRRLRFNPIKCEAMVVSAPRGSRLPATTTKGLAATAPAHPALTQPLVIQGHPIAWRSSVKYLGALVNAMPPTSRLPLRSIPPTKAAQKAARKKRKGRMEALRATFKPTGIRRGKRCLPHVRLATMAVKQVVLGHDLYPTAVMDVDFVTLDRDIFKFLCSLFSLPPDTHRALLWTELFLWPSILARDKRTLAYTRNLQGLWFNTHVLQGLMAHCGNFDLFRHGALARLDTTLRTYGLDLQTILADEPFNKQNWLSACKTHVHDRFCNTVLPAKLDSYTDAVKTHITQVMALAPDGRPLNGYPAYITYGGFNACIGLRAKAFSLRFIPAETHTTRPDCLLCGESHAECGAHLMFCSHLPAALQEARELLLCDIFYEVNTMSRRPPNRTTLPATLRGRSSAIDALRRLHWPHCSKTLVRRALKLYGRIINQYRRAYVGRPNPIRPVILDPLRTVESYG